MYNTIKIKNAGLHIYIMYLKTVIIKISSLHNYIMYLKTATVKILKNPHFHVLFKNS